MRARNISVACLVALLAISSGRARAGFITQYASNVIDFSSQFSSASWSAQQALGAPNTFAYGDIVTAWAPGPRNGTLEFITVGFATDVYADGFTVRETYGNGFVYQVDVLDTNSVLHTVWTGADPSLPGSPVDFSIDFSRTDYLVRGLKVYTNTDHDPNAWEEIDAIQLRGDTSVPGASVAPAPSGLTLLGSAAVPLVAYFGWRRRKQTASLAH